METISIRQGGPPPPLQNPYPLLPLERFFNQRFPASRARSHCSTETGMEVFDHTLTFEDWIKQHLVPTWANQGQPGLLGTTLLQLMSAEEVQSILPKVPYKKMGVEFWVQCGLYDIARMCEDNTPIRYGNIVIRPSDLVALCARFEGVGVIGSAPSMVAAYNGIAQLCASMNDFPGTKKRNILLRGGIGSGKGLIAEALHKICGRSEICRISCASFGSGNSLNSELFGHVKGAFTDAVCDRAGAIESATGGTLVLDDIDKMSKDAQGRFLSVLDGAGYRKLGTDEIKKPEDVLFVATTNADLGVEVAQERFLPDLRSRLNATVDVPELADRQEDIPMLVRHFLKGFEKSQAYALRFPLTCWLQRHIAASAAHDSSDPRSKPIDVRTLEEELIPDLRNHLHGFSSAVHDSTEARVFNAIAAMENRGTTPPFTQTALSEELGVGRSTLHEEAWKSAVNKAIEQGKIRRRRGG